MAIDPPTLVLPWLQLLHALSFGATHLGALMFLAHHTPAGQAATAQGYLAIAAGAAMAAAMEYRACCSQTSAAAPMRRWR
jgi:PPP family 3-phenylpropionic acid transporter